MVEAVFDDVGFLECWGLVSVIFFQMISVDSVGGWYRWNLPC